MKPHIETAHRLWRTKLLSLSKNTLVIDATVGNGHDTLFLAQLLQGEGELIGYDIQAAAISSCRQRLSSLPENQKANINLKNQSHAFFEEASADLIVYNLGYLPGGDKALTTQCETTLASLQKALEIVRERGAISITCYPGHAEGKKEQEAILSFLQTLSSSSWEICHYTWVNRPLSPTLFWILRALPRP